MGNEYDTLEALGAIVSGVGLAVLFIAGETGLVLGPLILAMGLILWKMGEMRREFKEKLEVLRREIELLKDRGGFADG